MGAVIPNPTVKKGATQLKNVKTINLGANMTISVGSNREVTIDASAEATPALTERQLAFGDASNDMTSSSDLTFNDTTKVLTVTGDADNDAVMEIRGSETAAGEGPRLLIRNTSGTDSGVDLTVDNFAVVYLRGGTPGGVMRTIWQSGQMSSGEWTFTLNPTGDNADFKVLDTSQNEAIHVDGENKKVRIGRESAVDTTSKAVQLGETDIHRIAEITGDVTRLTLEATNNSVSYPIANVQLYGNNFRGAGITIGSRDSTDGTLTDDWFMGRPYGTNGNYLMFQRAPFNGVELLRLTHVADTAGSVTVGNDAGG